MVSLVQDPQPILKFRRKSPITLMSANGAYWIDRVEIGFLRAGDTIYSTIEPLRADTIRHMTGL